VPKGIHTSPRGRKSKGAVRTEMNLSESTREMALLLGGSSGMVGGVERLFSMLPVFNECRSILEIIAEKPEQAIALQDQIKAVLNAALPPLQFDLTSRSNWSGGKNQLNEY